MHREFCTEVRGRYVILQAFCDGTAVLGHPLACAHGSFTVGRSHLKNESCVLFPPFSEGPCLIHSMNGDLLRTLDGPENCLKPKLIQASREGHCVIFYENGFFCTFSVNGKLQATMETEDNIRVSTSPTLQDLRYLPQGGTWGGERVP